MARRDVLFARLSDGSEVRLDAEDHTPESLMRRIVGELQPAIEWVPTEKGGRVRASSIIAVEIREYGRHSGD